ncbi:ATP-grasp enzyme [uncultured Jatrophihabitans sp.]|uniref:ATP-grasp enzyme n=1 Tax=uncultured Jatrophihabitans sp. TaxID=1610747 RepID=UPI0035C995D0
MSTPQAGRAALVVQARTAATLALLTAVLPLNAAVTAVAGVRALVSCAERGRPDRPRTVLISGGKMTKALQLARSFHRAGHRVVLVESGKYRLTGHRFSNAVDAFHTVPKPDDPGYADALLRIVQLEKVDVYVPVCSPAASYYDALAKPVLEPYCEVLHGDADVIAALDDKQRFAETAASFGLPVPDSHRVTAAKEVEEFDFAGGRPPYILKSIPYDPVHRLDLTPLPRDTPARTAEFARSKPMTPETPWIMQSFVPGQEYCTHSTVRDGRVQVFACCESSAFQINYEMVDKPAMAEWVSTFVGALGITGQVSFDFIEDADGEVYAIECNPRTHSAITMFYDEPALASAYLDDVVGPPLVPTARSRPTYWIYHEVWRLVTEPNRAARLRTILRGKDAIFDWHDPLPFLLEHHLQIPWLLLQSLRQGKDWIRIDFNIGKLVEQAGD